MRVATELRLFYVVVGSILLIPLVAGNVGAWGGLEGMAMLFGEDQHAVVAPALRNQRDGFSFESLNRPMGDVLWKDVKPGRARYRLQKSRYPMDVMGYLQLDARDHVIECQTSPGNTSEREDLARVMMCDSLVVLD